MNNKNENRTYLMEELMELETNVFKVRELNRVIARVYENEKERKNDVLVILEKINKSIVSYTNRKLYDFFHVLSPFYNIKAMENYIKYFVDDINMFAEEDLDCDELGLSREHIGSTSSFYYVTREITFDVIESLREVLNGTYEISDLGEALGLECYEESPEEYIVNKIDLEDLDEPDTLEEELMEAMDNQIVYDYLQTDWFKENIEILEKTHKRLEVFKKLVVYEFATNLFEDLQCSTSWIREEIDEYEEEEIQELNEALVQFTEKMKNHFDELIESEDKDVLEVINNNKYYPELFKSYEEFTLEIKNTKEVA